ncbi:hypothetical protein SteCoe_13413 [Stentor coeruleus]|uniref:Serine/threonine-protein phosphatase 4 regulatory subunit 3-like central domain-containing protein n=1 Tax=Stentor coeruleus TaxID=5963 RepID=A0A1R2C8J5_9CILI|nr:hypothetical protein SteCoe_13413 [Stentor coeruleus]
MDYFLALSKEFSDKETTEDLSNYNKSMSLFEILDDQKLFTTLKSNEPLLQDFFDIQKILELIHLIINSPNGDIEYKIANLYQYKAFELLTSGSEHFYTLFFREDKVLLAKLFNFLDNAVNETLSGYFSRLAILLLYKNPSFVLIFIYENGYLEKIADKVWLKSISDFANSIFMIKNTSEISYEIKKKLLLLIHKNFTSSNSVLLNFSAEIICRLLLNCNENKTSMDLITFIAENQQFCYIINATISSQFSKINAGIRILRDIINFNSCCLIIKYDNQFNENTSEIIKKSSYKITELGIRIINIIELLVQKLKRPSESYQSTLKNLQIHVLGEDRINITDFFKSCLKTGIKEIEEKLIQTGAIKMIVDIFFEFEMNSIFHTIFEQIVNTILSVKGFDDCLIKDLMESNIVKKLINNPWLKGYSGHATKIANLLIKAQIEIECVREKLENNESWNLFLNTYLNKRNDIEIKGVEDKKNIVMERHRDNPDAIEIFKKGFPMPPINKVKIVNQEINIKRDEDVKDCESKQDIRENKLIGRVLENNFEEVKFNEKFHEEELKIEHNFKLLNQEIVRETSENSLHNCEYWRFGFY